MDLHNNEIATQLAINPASKRCSDEQVIDYAIRNGYLRTRPYRVRGETEYLPGFEERRSGFTAAGRMYRDR